MLKIRRGDMVQVIKGKDKGKKGKIIKVFLQEKRALVEGINMLKKHKRRTRDDQKGGIISIESPLSVSNIMLICKNCGRAARVGMKFLEDKSKARFCKACKEVI